jgi:hypothetical protein
LPCRWPRLIPYGADEGDELGVREQFVQIWGHPHTMPSTRTVVTQSLLTMPIISMLS